MAIDRKSIESTDIDCHEMIVIVSVKHFFLSKNRAAMETMKEWPVYLLANYECSGALFDECRKFLSFNEGLNNNTTNDGRSFVWKSKSRVATDVGQTKQVGSDDNDPVVGAANKPPKRNSTKQQTTTTTTTKLSESKAGDAKSRDDERAELQVEWWQLIEKDEHSSAGKNNNSNSNNNITLATAGHSREAVLRLCSSLHRLVR